MKTLLSSLGCLAVAMTVSADVLLWQLPTTTITASDQKTGGTKTISTDNTGDLQWQYAMLRYTDETSLNYFNAGNVDGSANTAATYWQDYELTGYGNKAYTTFAGETLASNETVGKNWYIALYNSSDELVGFSQLYLNEDISSFRASSRNIASWDGVNMMGGADGGWVAAPEPTSGMLLLLGMAALGLRRRKVA